MIDQQDNLNGSAQAFVRAFSDLIKDCTSHLATKDDIANMATKDDIKELSDRISKVEETLSHRISKVEETLSHRITKVEETVAEGYKRIYSWRDEMYNTFARKDELRPSAFKSPSLTQRR